MTVADDGIVLNRFYQVARERPDSIYLTQPLAGGRIDDISFARALDEAKRMAAYLRSLGLPPRSSIAIVSKNCAHFFLSDLAIWMAGHVSVALFPTLRAETARYILEHSESRLLFVGKLDSWDEIAKGLPRGIPCVAYPRAPDRLPNMERHRRPTRAKSTARWRATSAWRSAARCCTGDAVRLPAGAFRPEIRGVGHPRPGTEDPRVGDSIPPPGTRFRARTSGPARQTLAGPLIFGGRGRGRARVHRWSGCGPRCRESP